MVNKKIVTPIYNLHKQSTKDHRMTVGNFLEIVQAGRIDLLTKTLNAGYNPNTQNEEGTTALHLAAQANHVDILRLLITYRANPNMKDEAGFTALSYAEYNGNTEAVKILLPITEKPSSQPSPFK